MEEQCAHILNQLDNRRNIQKYTTELMANHQAAIMYIKVGVQSWSVKLQ